jgi:hypothetical protein
VEKLVKIPSYFSVEKESFYIFMHQRVRFRIGLPTVRWVKVDAMNNKQFSVHAGNGTAALQTAALAYRLS